MARGIVAVPGKALRKRYGFISGIFNRAILMILQLDYIQGMGFTAIWITPITTQMEGITSDGSAYHGYWQQDMWVK
jgi:hypothetical protein